MKNKLFSIKENGLYYKIKFLGISFNLRSLKLAYKEIKRLRNKMITSRSPEFFFAAEDKFSLKEKIWYLSQEFYEVVGYYPNLSNPKTFNEKLNWMKLHYCNPIQSICIDKYQAKKYIDEKLGEGYTIPLIGVYDDINEIDFENLPKSFVIKTNFNGGGLGMKIVKDKSKLNIDKLKYEINQYYPRWNNLYYRFLSRGYKKIEPKILVEEYLKQLDGQLYDYKIFCFHGAPKAIEAIKDRKDGNFRASFYNEKWEPINLISGTHRESKLKKPENFDKMLEIAKTLSKDFPFVRVDLYNVDGKIYFGELSFTPASGFMRFNPKEWDAKFGELLDLNKIPKEFIIS